MKAKGTPKTGGRNKGTLNKTTTTVRVWLSELIENNREQIEADIKILDPKDRLTILEKFMQYTTPKMQSIQAEIEQKNEPKQLTIAEAKELLKKLDDEL